jgi:GNAT superfamily N-acetyltransferase
MPGRSLRALSYMDFSICAGTPQHAAGIAQVHVTSWRTTYKGIFADATLEHLDVKSRAQQWTDRLLNPETKTATFVAIDGDDRVIGFANGGPARSEELKADGELYAIYLYSDSQRKGIGSGLLRQLAAYLHAEGFSSLGVWVLERNPARLFYEALGAELVAEKMLTRDDIMLKEVGYRWCSIQPLLALSGD